MKLFVVCLLAFFAVAAHAELTAEQKEKLTALSVKCKESSGVDPALVEKLKTEKKWTDGDAKFDAYLHCIFAKFLNADGTVNGALVKEKLPEKVDKAEAGAAIDKCVEEAGSGADAAHKALKCLGEERRKYITAHA